MATPLARERAVLAAMAEGRSSASDALAELYPVVHAPIRRLCTVLADEPGDVDDVVQEVLRRVRGGRRRYD